MRDLLIAAAACFVAMVVFELIPYLVYAIYCICTEGWSGQKGQK